MDNDALSQPMRIERPPNSTAAATLANRPRTSIPCVAGSASEPGRVCSQKVFVQHLHARRLSFDELARLGRKDQQPLGETHRSEDARTLIARRARHDLFSIAFELDPHEVQTARLLAKGLRESRPNQRTVKGRVTGHASKRGSHEQLEGDHGRYGISRQSEYQRSSIVGETSKSERVAGLDVHAPEEQGAGCLSK